MRTTKLLIATAAFALGWPLAGSAPARILGGPPKSACLATIEDLTPTKGKGIVQCKDGDVCDSDGALNNSCTFKFRVCEFATDTGTSCRPSPVSSFKATAGVNTPTPGATSFTCADPTSIVVPLKGKKKKKQTSKKIKVIAKATGKPDTIKATLTCQPNTSGTTSTTLPPACATKNPDGGPDELDLEVGETGTDLDNGWTGVAHNFPVVAHSLLQVCLAGCDGTASKPICNAAGKTGSGTANGAVFGAPLPLLASGVPVCVVNRYNGDVSGQVNFLTGEITTANPLQVNLFADTYFTVLDGVCPRCAGGSGIRTQGKCDSGNRVNQTCTVDSMITVAQGIGDKNYPLSRDCPPSGSPAGGGQFVSTLDIRLPLTTQTSTLPGPKPCGAVQDDNCAGTCGTSCSGNACVSKDAQNRCIDAKGGISQNCCSDNPAVSCFPTRNGGSISRTGSPSAPSPAPPDPTFPKTGTGVLATTFCEAATAKGIINTTTGLPGPAALLLSGKQTWRKNP